MIVDESSFTALTDDAPYEAWVLGDVSGCLDVFLHMLRLAGVDESLQVPADRVLIQVGDLVHKGPDSDACVQVADQLLTKNPDHYIQLVGNHEAHYLGGPSVLDRPGVASVSTETVATLQRWLQRGLLQVAVPLDVNRRGPTLVTHAGVSVGLWEELGRPDHYETAHLLNTMDQEHWERATRPGMLVTGEITPRAGPMWADPAAELVEPWYEFGLRDEVPFNQIHGHAQVFDWGLDAWRSNASPRIQSATRVIHRWRQTTVEVAPHRTIMGVDWAVWEAPDGPHPKALAKFDLMCPVGTYL